MTQHYCIETTLDVSGNSTSNYFFIANIFGVQWAMFAHTILLVSIGPICLTAGAMPVLSWHERGIVKTTVYVSEFTQTDSFIHKYILSYWSEADSVDFQLDKIIFWCGVCFQQKFSVESSG